ncbi:hypothetical protein [Haloferax chudinovii]|uniref:Sulfatase N-terminal domain-containing protein n=1 Tax=Haloferax chudinovii TaxID=1109010 RepID=A0ABD5XP03_9EURY
MGSIPGVSAVRHAYTEISKNGNNRYWWRDRFINRVVSPTQQRIYGRGNAIDPFGGEHRYTDWDVLFVLDACRADLFEETVPDSGINYSSYEMVESPASSTPEWTSRLFEGRSFGDVVYITANPWTARVAPNSFHDRIDVWHDDFDDDVGTVRPEAMIKAAKAAIDDYPNKRIVVHLMQPHVPFIGGAEVDEGSKNNPEQVINEQIKTTGKEGSFGRLRYGDGDVKKVWSDYKSNLEIALKNIQNITNDIDGRIVLTSDHGNMFGEIAWPFPIRVYGHPDGLRSSPLIEVPWAVIESDSPRPTIKDDGAKHVPLPGEENQLSNKLESLGYK